MKLLLSLLLLTSCSFKKGQLENQTQNGHENLYSEAEAPKQEKSNDLKRVVIAATNDLHGHYQPHRLKVQDKHHGDKQTIGVGGVPYISSYFKILRQQFGEILLVDSGDIFSRAQDMNYVQDYYSLLDYDALTVGLKDFNLKLPAKYSSSVDFLKDFAKKSKTPVLMGNLYELKTARLAEWPGTLPYLLKEVNGVKVGMIGLIPDDIVEKTPVDNRVGLFVENMVQSTLRHSRLLRSLGAEIIVVMTHQALNCGNDLAEELNLPMGKVNFEPERSNLCDLSGQMGEYINRLPPNLVDVIIAGRNHQKTANYVNTTLVLSAFPEGQGFSFVEFLVDPVSKKVLRDKTVVHQPVMFCHEFFKETDDCYPEDPSVDHKARTPAKFLGQPVQPDPEMEQKFQHFLKTRAQVTTPVEKTIQSILDFHHGDISYFPSQRGNSKLVLLDLKGSELMDILEVDFNAGTESNWHPSPFEVKRGQLHLSVQGLAIDAENRYKVLAAIEDVQAHPTLKKFITRSENKSLHSVSWTEPGLDADQISTTMAASNTVR